MVGKVIHFKKNKFKDCRGYALRAKTGIKSKKNIGDL